MLNNSECITFDTLVYETHITSSIDDQTIQENKEK